MAAIAIVPILTPHAVSLWLKWTTRCFGYTSLPAPARRICTGFRHGLFQLGAGEVDTALPLFFPTGVNSRAVCDVALHPPRQRFPWVGSAYCGSADEELKPLALAAPPMTGGEYLTAKILQALWHEIGAAFAIELSQSKTSIQDFLKRRNPAWNLWAGYTSILPKTARMSRRHSRFWQHTRTGCLHTRKSSISHRAGPPRICRRGQQGTFTLAPPSRSTRVRNLPWLK